MATASSAISFSNQSSVYTHIGNNPNVHLPFFTMDPVNDLNSYAEIFICGYSASVNTTSLTNVKFEIQSFNHYSNTWNDNKDLTNVATLTGIGTSIISMETGFTLDGDMFSPFGATGTASQVPTWKLYPGQRIGFKYTNNPFSGDAFNVHFRAIKFQNGA